MYNKIHIASGRIGNKLLTSRGKLIKSKCQYRGSSFAVKLKNNIDKS